MNMLRNLELCIAARRPFSTLPLKWLRCCSSPADDDQLDLFYLVDRVLDEIEQAKQASSKRNTDAAKLVQKVDKQDTMPAESNEEFVTPNLMDHIDEALSPYIDGFYQAYNSHDEFMSQSLQQPERIQYPTDATHCMTDQLVDQSVLENECISHATKMELSSVSSVYLPETKTSNVGLYYLKDIIHDTFTQNESEFTSYLVQNDFAPSYTDNGVLSKKDTVKCKTSDIAFDELQKYSNLIYLPDMENYKPPVPSIHVSQMKSSLEQPACCTHAHAFYDDGSNDTSSSEFMSWTCKHPEHWSTIEVLDWLYYSAESHGVDCSVLRGEAFRAVNGLTLCKMGPEEFTALEPFYGQFLFKLFRQLIDNYDDQSFSYMQSDTTTLPSTTNCDLSQSHDVSTDFIQSIAHTTHKTYNDQPIPDGYFCNSEREPIVLTASVPASETPQPFQRSHNYEYAMGMKECDETSYKYVTSMYSSDLRRPQGDVTTIREKYDNDGAPVRRRPGRPRIKSIPTAEELEAQREKKLKSQHLWEFIYDMLNNTVYTPAILKWENQTEGVFRFIQSETVAQLWGTLKCNENMTYEKLSRAMRHYYKRGILERVEGRRLVYKFSRGTLDKMIQKRCVQTLSTVKTGEHTLQHSS